MYLISKDKGLSHIESRILHHAARFNRTLPEMKFIVLDGMEFISLLSKNVYPTSPLNIWEGKEVTKKKFAVESGQESSLYYEVVQTGRPSYAYLNNTNTPTTQASVMAHVVGHCEFSELNVMGDSNDDRTEYVMYLCRKINNSIPIMGFSNYMRIRNACESISPLISPNSQYNLKTSIISDEIEQEKIVEKIKNSSKSTKVFMPYSSTLDALMIEDSSKKAIEQDENRKNNRETINRKGYKLIAPCQDVLGFLKNYADLSDNERNVIEYIYTVNKPHDFVRKTQIMNEGWAMYWEKQIMQELFDEGTVKDRIDYSVKFSGVCNPRPWFMRNPYHLGYNMWLHVKELYEKDKVSIGYHEEKIRSTKEGWSASEKVDPIAKMEHLVSTITDYEFLRRFLDNELIEKFHLNRVPNHMAQNLSLSLDDVKKEDNNYTWLEPEPIKDLMLNFFVDFHQPMVYVIDSDFMDGGLLLFHRHKGKGLKERWIKPTLKNIKLVWKRPVYLISGGMIYKMYGKNLQKDSVRHKITFEQICEKMSNNTKPFSI